MNDPYDKTAQEMKRQSEGPKRFIKNAAGIGAAIGASSFAPILARAAPFLSQYIPEDLVIKGLSKISHKFGKFVKDAVDSGYHFNEVKDFIGDQVNQSQQNTQQSGNVIEQYSPELHQFISSEIEKGRSPIEAGALAELNGKFKNAIGKLTKDHKSPFSALLKTVYGEGQTQNKDNSQQQNEMQQNQSANQDDQALLQAIQKVLQM